MESIGATKKGARVGPFPPHIEQNWANKEQNWGENENTSRKLKFSSKEAELFLGPPNFIAQLRLW